MAEYPIIFTGESVQAIQNDRQTMTRRVDSVYYRNWKVGDLLWVRESISFCDENISYKISDKDELRSRWISPRFMPKWATRLWLEITAIRTERLRDITDEDVISEGWPKDGISKETGWKYIGQNTWYHNFWNSLNAKYGWNTNPTVKVISFKRINK